LLESAWTIEMLGGFRVRCGDRDVPRFSTQRTASLLAWLAIEPGTSHSREHLVALFWPDAYPELGRSSLRTALASLRRQLEPPGVPAGSVIEAGRISARLNPVAIVTDVQRFQAALRDAADPPTPERRRALLTAATELCAGELLPGFPEECFAPIRARIGEQCEQALAELSDLCRQTGDVDGAIRAAQRLCRFNPLNEEAHARLVRLAARAGRPEQALRFLDHMEIVLREAFGPAIDTRAERLRAEIAALIPVDRGSIARPAYAVPPNVEDQPDRAGRPDEADPTRWASAPGGAPLPAGSAAPAISVKPPSAPTKTPDAPAAAAAPARRPTAHPAAAPAGSAQQTAESPVSPLATGRQASLPLPYDRFFGRGAELSKLDLLIQGRGASGRERLVTVTGRGGVGKTRLAVEWGRRLAASASDSIWFVSLASLNDPREIANEIVRVFRIAVNPQEDPLEQAIRFLASAQANGAPGVAVESPPVLILDNFEQVAAGGAETVRRLLDRLPDLCVLVTSRRRLGMPDELALALPPLPLPEAAASLAGLMESPSIQLFVDRAQRVLPDFQVTRGNAAAVAGICSRLEGAPLALELAAARAASFTPSQILERIAERLDWLASRAGARNPRHSSLRAAIQWSFDLLTAELKALFKALSVFRGGWLAEDAEAVCAQPACVEYLAQLRDRSLISLESTPDRIRFRMADSLREFAEDQLTRAERTTLGRSHAMHFLRLAEEADPRLLGAGAKEWLERLELELENLRAAQDWALGHAEFEMALRFSGYLMRFWLQRGYLAEGRRRTEAALAAVEGRGSPEVRAGAMTTAGVLAATQCDFAVAVARYTGALAIHRETGNANGLIAVLSNLGVVALERGDYAESLRLHAEAEQLTRRIGNEWRLAGVLNTIGCIRTSQGDYQGARPALHESLAIRRRLEDRACIASTLSNLGNIEMRLGRYTEACALQRESLALREDLGDEVGVATARVNLANVLAQTGDAAGAREEYLRSLPVWIATGGAAGLASVFVGLAEDAVRCGEATKAARLLGAAEAIYARTGVRTSEIEDVERGLLRERARAVLGEAALAREWAIGGRMSLQEAAREAGGGPPAPGERAPSTAS